MKGASCRWEGGSAPVWRRVLGTAATCASEVIRRPGRRGPQRGSPSPGQRAGSVGLGWAPRFSRLLFTWASSA